jgi:hypothetical protein
LIGRSYLKDQFLVNVGKTYLASPSCQGETVARAE